MVFIFPVKPTMIRLDLSLFAIPPRHCPLATPARTQLLLAVVLAFVGWRSGSFAKDSRRLERTKTSGRVRCYFRREAEKEINRRACLPRSESCIRKQQSAFIAREYDLLRFESTRTDIPGWPHGCLWPRQALLLLLRSSWTNCRTGCGCNLLKP